MLRNLDYHQTFQQKHFIPKEKGVIYLIKKKVVWVRILYPQNGLSSINDTEKLLSICNTQRISFPWALPEEESTEEEEVASINQIYVYNQT